MSDILNAIGDWPVYAWFFVMLIVALAVVPINAVITRRHTPPDVSIRMTALSMAIDSHGPEAGKPHDACFTARAAHFEDYLRSGAP